MQEIQADSTERLAYFYCSSKEGQSTNSTVILRSLIAQLAWSPDGFEVASSVKALHGHQENQLHPELFASLAAQYQRTTVVIDALDECEDYSRLLFLLKKVFADTPSTKLKFFFSRRPSVNMLLGFPSWEKLELDLNRGLTKDDMNVYISTQVVEREGHRLLNGKDPDLEKKLIDTLSYRAQGM